MNLIELDRALKQLRLGGMAAVLETRLRQAQAEPLAPIDLLSCLVSDELALRGQRLLERRTKQAQFRDSHKKTQKVGAVVLGISPDTSKAQKKFEEKFDLPFTLLADADKKVCNLYGVIQEKNMYGKKVTGVARTTFIIGPDGKIKHIFHKVKPEGHSAEVLAYLKSVIKGAA